MAGLRYLDNVVTLDLDSAACTGCGMCVAVCPHGVFEITDRGARIVDRDACIECGACMRNCAYNAVSVDPGVGCVQWVLKSWFAKDGECVECGC